MSHGTATCPGPQPTEAQRLPAPHTPGFPLHIPLPGAAPLIRLLFLPRPSGPAPAHTHPPAAPCPWRRRCCWCRRRCRRPPWAEATPRPPLPARLGWQRRGRGAPSPWGPCVPVAERRGRRGCSRQRRRAGAAARRRRRGRRVRSPASTGTRSTSPTATGVRAARIPPRSVAWFRRPPKRSTAVGKMRRWHWLPPLRRHCRPPPSPPPQRRPGRAPPPPPSRRALSVHHACAGDAPRLSHLQRRSGGERA